jgi:hypothetical protein
MTDKIFIDGMFTDEHKFDNGGEIIKLTFTDAFMEYYEANKTVNGKGNMQLKVDLKRGKESKALYAELNTFVPKAQVAEAPAEDTSADDFDSEIPFN